MASKTIDIVISTILKKTGIDAARAQLKSLASSVGKNLTNIKSAFDLAGSAVRTFVAAMSKGMEFERMTVTFKNLTGSLDLAKAHMKDLQDLGRTPPFSLEAFAGASQMMMKMTDGMLGYKQSLEMVGDIAAATGNDINAVARSVGLAYQMLRDGQPFGRAGSQMVQLGILTKAQVEHFDNLSKAGGDNMALWNELTQTLGKYKGAMADTEKTTKGMIEAIEGEATVAMTDFSTAISESAKPALEGLLGWMKRINEDGTIEEWAFKAVEAFEAVKDGAAATLGPIAEGMGYVWKTLKGSWGSVGNAIGGAVGTLAGGGSIGDAAKAGWSGYKEGWSEAFDSDGAEAEASERRKQERRERKAKKRAEASAKAEAEAQARMEADMAQAKEKTDKRVAEEKAKEAEKAHQQELKRIEAEKKAREKAEAEIHKQRVDNLNAEIKASETKASGLQGVAQSAQTEFDKAFGMYRSEDHGAAAIAEERDYAADYKQLQKDASRYGGKWRIDELAGLMAAGDTKGQAAKLEEWRKSSSFTPEVESMVRAAAADQTKTTAEDELRQINSNTKELADKLDQLLQVK